MIGSFIQKLHQGVDPSRSLCNGGSGGGGSSGVKYDNLEKLYGTQQQAAGFMLDQAMPRIPGILNNTEQMVGDAMSGALADQMRGRAAYDANQSIASSNNDAIRKLTSYGAAGDPSGGRFADVMNQNAFNSAKVRAGSMNTANNYAEDQKWNRNAGMYGQVSGMSTGAMQGMSSAGAGLSNLTAQQNQNAAANAQGFGQFGAAIGSAVTKADGGYIRKRRAPGLATGGDAWQAYKAANPGTTGGGGRRGYGMGQAAMQILGGASPHLLGAVINDLAKGDKGTLLTKGKELYNMYTAPAASEFTVDPGAYTGVGEAGYGALEAGSAGLTKAAVSEAAGLGSSSAAGAGGAAGAGAGGAALAETGTGAGAAAGAGAGAGAGAAAGTVGGVAADGGGFVADWASMMWAADGGPVEKRGLRFALGGGVRSPIAANASMSMPLVSQMDDKAVSLPAQAQQGAVDTRYMGKTDGMGETSAGDPDGFGKEGPDNRHMAGKATMSVFGRWLGGQLGGMAGSALAEVVHPVGEAVSRGAITTGDKAGGVSGAILMDPIGTSASGKYKPEDIAKGNLAIAAGVPWAGKFFSEGGDVEPQRRADYTPGGDVRGPGTETSDDIPAWLSDGEVVHNADAVKLAGKDAMLAINDAGLQAREGKASPEEAQQAIGKVMVQRGQQLLQGRRKVGGLKLASGGCATGGKKYGLKLAGGGMLGNLGIALGAGVNQWNRQQALDMQQQQIDLQKSANQRAEEQASRAATEHEWKINDRKTQDGLRAELGDIEKRAALGDTNEYMAGKQDEAKAAAALSGIEYQPLTEEQRKVIASTPGLAKMTPHLRYEMDMQRAAALRKAGDFKSAEAYADKATSQATGDFMRSLMSGDFRSAGKLYNIYPNGHTIDGMEAGEDDDHVTVIDKGERKKVSRYDLMTGALAQMDPKAAASLMAQDKKLEAYMERLRQQISARSGGGSGGSGKATKVAEPGYDDFDKAAHKGLDDYFHKEYALTIGEGDKAKSYSGPQLALQAKALYRDVRASNPNISPERAAHIARAMTESDYGKADAEFARSVELDKEGNPIVQIRQRGVSVPEGVLAGKSNGFGNGIANPQDFSAGGAQGWQKKVMEQTLNRFGGKEADIYAEAKRSDADIAAAIDADIAERRKADPKITDEAAKEARVRMLRAATNWRNHAQMYAKAKPEKIAEAAENRAAGQQSDGATFGVTDRARLWQLETAEKNGNLPQSMRQELVKLRELQKTGGQPWYTGRATADDAQ